MIKVEVAQMICSPYEFRRLYSYEIIIWHIGRYVQKYSPNKSPIPHRSFQSRIIAQPNSPASQKFIRNECCRRATRRRIIVKISITIAWFRYVYRSPPIASNCIITNIFRRRIIVIEFLDITRFQEFSSGRFIE